MKKQAVASLVGLAFASYVAVAQPSPPFDPSRWNLDFQDEFSGNELNESNWNLKTGEHGNRELEWYIPEQVAVKDGTLVLTADRSKDLNTSSNHPYISGWIDGNSKRWASEGRFEASCMYYVGAHGLSQGLWPAIWLMPQNGSCWPTSGEIDIMESVGGKRHG